MDKIQAMSDSEKKIMEIIWRNGGSILLTSLLEMLNAESKNWKRTTVQTFLTRLIEKKILTYKKSGRNSEYIALLSEEEYMVTQANSFLHKVYNGNVKNLISTLLKQSSLTADDFEELKKFWNGGKDIK